MEREKQIHIDPMDQLSEFPLTAAPFERDMNKFSSFHLDHLITLYGSLDKVKYELGFQEEDMLSWQRSYLPVLEVGPGMGVSFEQVYAKGVNLYAIEPSLKYNSSDYSFNLATAKNRLLNPKYSGRVSSANASDAPYAFPNIKFQTAYAIGINFQRYAHSSESLVNQIGGILEVLSDDERSFFTFPIDKNGSCHYNIQSGMRNAKQLELAAFLDDREIRYKIVSFRDQSLLEDTAIRIYSTSRTGRASEKFNLALQEDMSKYVVPL